MVGISIVELVSGAVVDQFDGAHWQRAYEVRDRAQEAALRSGWDLTERRYGLRHG